MRDVVFSNGCWLENGLIMIPIFIFSTGLDEVKDSGV